VSVSAVDLRIRSLRPPKAHLDPLTAQSSLVERERRPNARIESALTVFLTGAECPFTCCFCDLWKFTLDGPTPRGALTAQLVKEINGVKADRLKLYNSSNFFDSRAVPVEDAAAIAKLAEPFSALTVESHASMIGPRAVELAREISGRLEVAIGLETIHPTALEQLNKRLNIARFDRAAAFLRDHDIDLRVFVLLGAPFIPRSESIEWTVRTVQHAARAGASIVSIIPVRSGNGEMERLEQTGEVAPPTLSELEQSVDECAGITGTVVTADLWDSSRLSRCAQCFGQRIERLERFNLTGLLAKRAECQHCGRSDAIM
jgi:radical SAM enzyme (TIGR01210 family)